MKASSAPIWSRVTADMRVARGPLGVSLAGMAGAGAGAGSGAAGTTFPGMAVSTGAGAAVAAGAGAGSEAARLVGRSKIRLSDLSFEKI